MFQRLKTLSRNLAIYGVGDVLTSLASFLLLPLYVRYLSPDEYGIIALLLSVEAVAKILFRCGVDASFMRLYFDCPDPAARQRLASTLFFFLLGLNGLLLAAGLVAAPAASEHLFESREAAIYLRLVLLNTFLTSFSFLPFHMLRIENRSGRFIGLTVSRSVSTLLLRLWLVVGLEWGVFGVVFADTIVSVGFVGLLLPGYASLLRPKFSWPLLKESLHFGLPRLPHGLATQTIAVADRYLLSLFVTLREIGHYSIGATFGLALKLFLSAFEYAWAPFYFSLMREPDAKDVYRQVTTYGITLLVFLTAGLSAIADDLVRLMTVPEFYPSARIIPWIAIGVSLQGVYLLTSIGLNITKRTAYYPVATTVAATVSIGANLVLIPRFGALGAAYANVLAYGTLALSAFVFSQRFYPIRHDWRRIAHATAVGVGVYALARLVSVGDSALAGLLARGGLVAVAFPAVLGLTGYVQPRELTRLKRLRDWKRATPVPSPAIAPEEMAGEIVDSPLAEPADAGPGLSPAASGKEGRTC